MHIEDASLDKFQDKNFNLVLLVKNQAETLARVSGAVSLEKAIAGFLNTSRTDLLLSMRVLVKNGYLKPVSVQGVNTKSFEVIYVLPREGE